MFWGWQMAVVVRNVLHMLECEMIGIAEMVACMTER